MSKTASSPINDLDPASAIYPKSMSDIVGKDVRMGEICWNPDLMREVVSAFHMREFGHSFKAALYDLHREVGSGRIDGKEFVDRLRELGQLSNGERAEMYAETFDEYTGVIEFKKVEPKAGEDLYII